MKCPFLEEVVVRYCEAYPVKKMIPSSGEESICLGDKHCKCQTFRDVAGADASCSMEKCESQNTKPNEVSKMEAKEAVETAKEIPGKERLCVWAKLGVISYRLCTLNYTCDKCQFNQSLTDASGKYAGAPEMFNIINQLRSLPAAERKCRYMLMGEVSYKLCPNNYQCGSCEYDQMMHDAVHGHPKLMARMAKVKQVRVKGFLLLNHLYFYEKHTWVRRMNATTVRVGLDDFAQRLLGKIDGINYLCDREVHQGEIGWEVKTSMGTACLPSPINGIVKKMNEDLYKDCSLLNTAPYDKGWIFEIEPFDMEASLAGLLKGNMAKDWMGKEVERLSIMTEGDIGVAIADGGELVGAIEGKIDRDEWLKLIA